MENKFPHFQKLYGVVEALLDPTTGCPWDLKQTHESLTQYLIEESYEFVDAVDRKHSEDMVEELGDVLLQVLLHCEISRRASGFNWEMVSEKLATKLIERHPHVFKESSHGALVGSSAGSSIESSAESSAETKKQLTSEDVLQNWQEIKKAEKLKKITQEKNEVNEGQGEKTTPAEQSFKMLPSLLAAKKIGDWSKNEKFDWSDYSQVVYKVEEEWQELKEELPPNGSFNTERAKEELGDMLFSLVQLARHLKLDPEEALRKSNQKFMNRFSEMQKIYSKHYPHSTTPFKNLDDETKNNLWNQAKLNLKKSSPMTKGKKS
jgi:uncharacterized protein YabN with tetrapyrrole methylase and pyrophosphatase domain